MCIRVLFNTVNFCIFSVMLFMKFLYRFYMILLHMALGTTFIPDFNDYEINL